MRIAQGYILFICVFIGACGDEALPPLVANDVNITAPMPGKSMSAGYLSITNNTDDTVNISHIESTHFATVEIHESVLEDGIAKMHRLEALVVPAHSTVRLERGGKHLMLMRPADEQGPITLSFFSEATLLLSVSAPLTMRKN